MSRKVLTGTYASGYNLHLPVTIVTLAASGYVGGTGIATTLEASAAYTVVNHGRINGSATGSTGCGVFLYDGGKVTNGSAAATSASIVAYRGVSIQQAVGTVINFGTIAASERSGVLLGVGGSVTNGSVSDTSALISTAGSDSAGIECNDFDPVTYKYPGIGGTITNFGTVIGNQGVFLAGGGRITNGATSDTGALIRGEDIGLYLYSDTGTETATVTNFGTIAGGGASGYGVRMTSLGADSTLTNGSGADEAALITGNTGVYINGALETVVNFGTIQGTGGIAVYLGGAGDKLVLEAGSTLLGGVAAAAGTLAAAGGVATIEGDLANVGAIIGTGTLRVAGAISLFAPGSTVSRAHVALGGEAYVAGGLTVENRGVLTARSLAVGANDTLTVTGTASSLTVTGGAKVVAGGVINATTGALVEIDGALSNNGVMEVTGGTMLLTGSLAPGGSFRINGGTLQEGGPTIGNVVFTGSTGTLALGLDEITIFSVLKYKGTVSGLSTTGTSSLDLLNVFFNAETTATYVDNGHKTGGVLSVTGEIAGQGQEAEITLVGDYSGATWILGNDGGGGTTVAASTPGAAAPPHALVPGWPVHSSHSLITAMASLGATAASVTAASSHVDASRPTLLRPRVQAV